MIKQAYYVANPLNYLQIFIKFILLIHSVQILQSNFNALPVLQASIFYFGEGGGGRGAGMFYFRELICLISGNWRVYFQEIDMFSAIFY